MIRRPPRSTLFPYTTLFRSRIRAESNTSFTASPWAANEKIFALSEDGDTFVFQAGAEYKLLHKNSLDEMCMATPAIAGDRKSTRLNSSHSQISYAVFCLKKK